MNKVASSLVVDIAKDFIEYASAASSEWDEAFLRFHRSPGESGVTSIYRAGADSEYFRSPAKFDFYDAVQEKFVLLCEELAREPARSPRVCLLRIDSDYNYKMFYEYEDVAKWAISKEDGQSGIPRIEE